MLCSRSDHAFTETLYRDLAPLLASHIFGFFGGALVCADLMNTQVSDLAPPGKRPNLNILGVAVEPTTSRMS